MINGKIKRAINKASARHDIEEIKRLKRLAYNNYKKRSQMQLDPYLDMKPIYLYAEDWRNTL